jgi:hypothetical protein
VRYSGCVWPALLRDGDTTEARTCLAGSRRVYFDLAIGDAAMFLGQQTTSELDGRDGATLRVVLEPDGYERDLTAPGPFGH